MGRLALAVMVLLFVRAGALQATTLRYQFLRSQSQIALTCGFDLCDDIYSIQGSLGLNIDFGSGTAAFVDVDGVFVGEGIASGRRLDTVLGPHLLGTVVNESTIAFGRRSPPPPDVFTVQMVGELLYLTGGFDDTFVDGEAISIQAVAVSTGNAVLQAGDADRDLDFDQLDVIQVQQAGKYLTRQAATWGEGDWDGAPGRIPGVPPPGNGHFDQFDVITALGAGTYLAGPYAAVTPTFAGSLGSKDYGHVNQAGVDGEFLLNDLTVVGSLAGESVLGEVELIDVPEPGACVLLVLGLLFAPLACPWAGRCE